jgi:hypothetical protein
VYRAERLFFVAILATSFFFKKEKLSVLNPKNKGNKNTNIV